MDGKQTGVLGGWALVEFHMENCRIGPVGFHIPVNTLDLNKHRTYFYKYFISKSFYQIFRHIPIMVKFVINNYGHLT
jgi:hypothetical protein